MPFFFLTFFFTRWCELRKGFLHIFEGERAVIPTTQLDLLGATASECDRARYDRENTFSIALFLVDHARMSARTLESLSQDRKEVVVFQAPSESSLLAWLETLEVRRCDTLSNCLHLVYFILLYFEFVPSSFLG